MEALSRQKRQHRGIHGKIMAAGAEKGDFPSEKLLGDFQLVFVAQAMEDQLFRDAGEDFWPQGLLRACEDVAFEGRVGGVLEAHQFSGADVGSEPDTEAAEIKSLAGGNGDARGIEELQQNVEHTHRLLLEIFASAGTRVLPMNDLDHFRHYKRFLNPSLAERFDFDPAGGFAPELSIQENCWHSEGNGQSDFGYFLEGHYHSLIGLTRWPRTTYPGIIERLTNLHLLDYTITVNIDPLPITQEISKEEKEHDRVAGDYASEKKISLLTVMEKKQKKIHALMQGQTFPFHALFVVRVWDKSKDGLNAKAAAFRTFGATNPARAGRESHAFGENEFLLPAKTMNEKPCTTQKRAS